MTNNNTSTHTNQFSEEHQYDWNRDKIKAKLQTLVHG